MYKDCKPHWVIAQMSWPYGDEGWLKSPLYEKLTRETLCIMQTMMPSAEHEGDEGDGE